MRRSHREAQRERRIVSAVIAATCRAGATAREVADATGLTIHQVYNHLVALQRDGEVGRHTTKRLVGRTWQTVFVRSDALLTHRETDVVSGV